MSPPDRGRAESIRQRLRNLMRERGEDAQLGLQRYAVERFLYKLGESAHRERFILKGAALFALWGGAAYRATRDVDFTGYGNPDEADILAVFREICEVPSLGDELVFDDATLTAEPIRDESEYRGFRVRLVATLGESRIPVQIDIGFGNAIHPQPQEITYPTLLDDPAPHIRAYPLEAVVAEKFHAMVLLGDRNTRFKDFYDLHVIARQFPFEGEQLAKSIATTFERRRTEITTVQSTALSTGFFADEGRAMRWSTYLDRNRLPGAPTDFTQVGETIITFLSPVWTALATGEEFVSIWEPGGPWRVRR